MPHLALAGAAHIHTPAFIRKLAGREGITVAGVWDPDADRAARGAEALGCGVLECAEAAWEDPSVDAVLICAETDRHASLVVPAAEAGKHLFVEKPLGMGAADAAQMAEAIEAAGVIFQTGYFMRGLPVHQFIRNQIRAGAFGEVTRVRHSNCHAGSLGGWFDTEWRWMADPARAGCGAFGDLGTHVLDILIWLLGPVEAVTADTRIVTGRYPGCDETGEGMMRFTCGAIGTFAGAWVDVADPVKLQVSGTEGHAVVMGESLYFQSEHVAGADGARPWTELPEAWPHAFDLFLDAVSGASRFPLVSAREAAYRSQVMEAMYRAAADRRWETVGPGGAAGAGR